LCANKTLLFGEKTTVEAKVWLDKHYSDPGKSIIEKRFGKFKHGEMSIEHDPRSGRSLSMNLGKMSSHEYL
jgi:hypothetical protein